MSFIEDFQKLYWSTPQDQNWTRQSENCDYGDIIVVSKNCFLCFNSANLENCLYCHSSKKSYDCNGMMFCTQCNMCYECIDSIRLNNCDYCQNSEGLSDCDYCIDCKSLNNCFGCVGLYHKKYHIFNKEYEKEDYFKKLKEIKAWPEEKIEAEIEKLNLEWPHVYMHQNHTVNSFGDYVFQCKNCYFAFDAIECEDSFYVTDIVLERGTKDSCDCGPICNTAENCYGCCFCGYINNCNHIYWCDYLADCEWCTNVWDSKHCFGCVYTKNKEYHILNKPYSKEEYEKKVKEYKKELTEKGILDLYGLINYPNVNSKTYPSY